MAGFHYRGRNVRGELVTGRLEGADSGAVADQLLTSGVTPVEIRAAGESVSVQAPDWIRKLFAPGVRDIDLMLFSRQMYTLQKAGVPILRALAGLQESATNPTFKEVIGDLRASLDAGRELSAAMRRHPEVFNPFYISLVRVGETTGQLEESFNRLFLYLEFERETRQRVKAAVRYPIIVVVVIAVAIAIVNFAVIPAFAKIFEANKVPLPLLTRFLIGMSDFFINYWYVLLGAIVGAVAWVRVTLATDQGRYAWDRIKSRLPIAGPILLRATLARFARSMSLAVRAGVPIVQSLSVVADVVDNRHIAQRIEQMRDGVERGESILRTATVAGVFTPTVLQMIAVGEETGELDDLLAEVADMYEREVDYDVKNLAASIEPILTIALGILILILALGVFLPIWDMGRVMLKK
ncbi:MAG: type II secretion system F family protein [Betaproteobacteria bacterium]